MVSQKRPQHRTPVEPADVLPAEAAPEVARTRALHEIESGERGLRRGVFWEGLRGASEGTACYVFTRRRMRARIHSQRPQLRPPSTTLRNRVLGSLQSDAINPVACGDCAPHCSGTLSPPQGSDVQPHPRTPPGPEVRFVDPRDSKTRPLRTRDSGPEVPEAEGDRIEGAEADRLIVLRARNQHPLPFTQLERLQGPVRGVDEPQVIDPLVRVDGAFLLEVDAACRRRQNLRDPVRSEGEVGGVGKFGHPFAAPPGEVPGRGSRRRGAARAR